MPKSEISEATPDTLPGKISDCPRPLSAYFPCMVTRSTLAVFGDAKSLTRTPTLSGLLRRFQVFQLPDWPIEPNRTRNPASAQEPMKFALAKTIPEHHVFAVEQGPFGNKLLKPLDGCCEFVKCEFGGHGTSCPHNLCRRVTVSGLGS